MNLVERLKKVDKKEFDKIETKQLESKALSKLLGEETKITIQAVDGDLYMNYSATSLDANEKVDYGKVFTFNALIVTAGVIEPNLKDETLLKHIGASTPEEAARKIFKGEINKISNEISELSGFLDEEKTQKEIKN